MNASKFTDAQKAFIIKQVKDWMPVASVCRKLGISSATFLSWKKKDAGLMPPEMKRHYFNESQCWRRRHRCGSPTETLRPDKPKLTNPPTGFADQGVLARFPRIEPFWRTTASGTSLAHVAFCAIWLARRVLCLRDHLPCNAGEYRAHQCKPQVGCENAWFDQGPHSERRGDRADAARNHEGHRSPRRHALVE